MLRAEAPAFSPQELPIECADTAQKAKEDDFTEETCSTVAPSPELTNQDMSPMLSPFWGFEDAGFSPDAMWASALDSGYMWEGYFNCLPEFSLPELQLAYMGQHADFMLKGEEEDESQDSTSAGLDSPPGLAQPPGLEVPPGLQLDECEAPPGLEAYVKAHSRSDKITTEKSSKLAPLPAGTTTAMLRNIPNKYTQQGLVERLHETGYRGKVDFIYLPIDFKNKCNVGYAFLNFRTAEACAHFASEYHHANSRDKLPGYNSKKVCEVSVARFQGCEENTRRLQTSSVMPELIANPDWLPKLFDENGEELDFPTTEMSTEVLPSSRIARGRLQKRK